MFSLCTLAFILAMIAFVLFLHSQTHDLHLHSHYLKSFDLIISNIVFLMLVHKNWRHLSKSILTFLLYYVKANQGSQGLFLSSFYNWNNQYFYNINILLKIQSLPPCQLSMNGCIIYIEICKRKWMNSREESVFM